MKDFLPIIRDSFGRPELISAEVDKKPKVTLLLLDYLRLKMTSDSQTQLDIDQTIEFLNRASRGGPTSPKEQ